MYIGRTELGVVRHGLLIAKFSAHIYYEINQIVSESCVVSREPDMEQDSVGLSATCRKQNRAEEGLVSTYIYT